VLDVHDGVLYVADDERIETLDDDRADMLAMVATKVVAPLLWDLQPARGMAAGVVVEQNFGKLPQGNFVRFDRHTGRDIFERQHRPGCDLTHALRDARSKYCPIASTLRL
jgi:hypothetical protein